MVPDPPTRHLLPAYAVHAFTASGAVLGLLALQAAGEGRRAATFAWLGLALVVDGIDGTIARRVGVAGLLPRYSGEVLDLVVDYLTYVVVPVYLMIQAGLAPTPLAWPLAAAILISSAFYFADAEMKTAEGGFRGFPAIWNVVIFLLAVFGLPGWINAVAMSALVAATFAPFAFVHPFRVTQFRPLTLGILGVWTMAAILAIAADLRPEPWVTAVLGGASLYLAGIGTFVRWAGRRRVLN
ncbi:MAG: phosphatidylcholine synthase [Phreatobacter sp.]|nr:phosphatidylcholine synthase [Phreatobacter sp.]